MGDLDIDIEDANFEKLNLDKDGDDEILQSLEL